jgi:IclR family pca regulon transcriptional regulator
VVYIARSSPPRWLTIGYAVGVRVPAHVVTPGVVILSTFTDAALDTWIAAHEFASFTAHTVTDPGRFRSDVLVARSLGYSHTEQQLDPGLQGMSVALMDRKGACRGAVGVTVSVSTYRSSADVREAVLPLLRDVAQSLRPLL